MYSLQSHAAARANKMTSTPQRGKVAGISLVDDTSERMVVIQFGEIIRIDTKQSLP